MQRGIESETKNVLVGNGGVVFADSYMQYGVRVIPTFGAVVCSCANKGMQRSIN